MPPQTRSRGKAPPSRVYHSSPAPAQLEFPRRRKAARTYGRQPQSARSLRQSTLTQIGYVEPVEPEDFDMEPTPDERRQKRRKTMGDTPSSSFYTQTLTQFLSTAGDNEDAERLDDSDIEKEENEDGDSRNLGHMNEQVPNKALSHVTDSRATSMIPQTPVHKKAKSNVWEVPSSQPTPGTPIGTSPLDTERYRIPPLRSPLQEMTHNINPSLPTLSTSERATKPRKMVIEDSYSSAPGFPSSNPTQSPFKAPRLPYVTEVASARASMELGELIPERRPTPSAIAQEAPGPNHRRPLGEIELEIPDSDDELLSLGPTPVKSVVGAAISSTPRDIPSERTEALAPTTPKVSSEEELEIESSDAEYDPGSPTPVARKVHSNPRPISVRRGDSDKAFSSSTGNGPSKHRTAVTPTPPSRNTPVEALEASEADLLAATPFTTQKSVPKSPPSHNTRSRSRSRTYYTQGLESQRVPLEVIRSMAPQTDRSDIIISIHPEPADLIASGRKNHEFRNYKIPNTVSRLWMYVTRPLCELRYMATIGPAKQPGEIDEHSGIGNRDFNAQTGSKFAYELLQVYQLNNPVSLAMMKKNGWVEGPPQKYVYVPPAVVGQLLGNLRCALFADETQSNHEESQLILSTPQQIEDQLRSDIIHSTQRTTDDVFARPQLPASKTPASAQRPPTLPQLPSLPQLHGRQEVNAVRPSQATTASEASSPAVSPEKSVPRPLLGSSGPSFPDYVEDEGSVGFMVGQHYSLGSSQVRLPESLMVDDFRPPPDISDSDEEDDD
ncbi:hypothetical protein BR93DRAFT_885760 [Coniochaeta sp. PMI_546]|nr:hypothetical protein BR93DRAFT_885760 [Coniochaeta sp. PMI_546]